MNKTRLTATEKELLDPGFRQVYTVPGQDPLPVSQPSKLAGLKKGQRIHPQIVRTRRHLSPPLPAMHEAELIKALRTRKIGRPATYVLIIETLLARRYAMRDETGKLCPTPRGREVCAFLVNHFSALCAYEFTVEMEGALDAMANGRVFYVEVVGKLWQTLQEEAQANSHKEKTL
jgi:DNA topoisomerase I